MITCQFPVALDLGLGLLDSDNGRFLLLCTDDCCSQCDYHRKSVCKF